MALALSLRQGRLVPRLLGIVDCSNLDEAFSRPAPSPLVEAEAEAEVCSTSQSGKWPSRFSQLRSYAVNNKPSISYVPVPEPARDDYTAAPTNYLQLLGSLRNARNLSQLQQLVNEYGSLFDAVHLAAAIARLPRLVHYRQKDLIDRSSAIIKAGAGISRFQRKHGAQLKESHAQAAAALAAQLDAMLPAHVQNFFPRQAACTVWAFGELRRKGVLDRMAHLADVLLVVTKGDYEAMRVHAHGVDFAQLFQGLAKLGHRHADLLARLAGLFSERIDAVQPRELQMAAWGLAELGCAEPGLLNAIADRLLRAGTTFLTPGGLTSLFWAYARARVHRRDLLEALTGSMLGQALLLTPQDCATTLWACAVLGYRHDPLLAVLGDTLMRSLASASDHEVAGALDAMAALGYHHVNLCDAVADSILAEPVIGAEPRAMSRVLFAYARLGRVGERDVALAARLAEALARRAPAVDGESLAVACRGLAVYGYGGKDALSAFTSRAESLLSSLTAPQLVAVLDCLARGSAPHYQLAVASARHLASSLLPGGQADLATATEVLFLCARQGVEDKEAAKALLETAAEEVAELRPVDAARLLVVAQVMNQQHAVLQRAAGVAAGGAGQLDWLTAEAAQRSAEAAGRAQLAGLLGERVRALSLAAGA